MNYHGVRFGRKPGVYDNWEWCKLQVVKFCGSDSKSFPTECEARDYSTGDISTKSKKRIGNEAGVNVARKLKLITAGKTRADNVEVAISSSQQALKGATPAPRRRKTQSLGVYTLKYDGASKGNPGRAGAGALLLRPDGTLVCNLSEGVGITTNNVAEYRGLILGLREALQRGVSEITAQGDSTLVCKQVSGKWKVNSLHLQQLCNEAKYLAKRFKTFSIDYVPRAQNAEADSLANLGVNLPEKAFISLFDTKNKSPQQAVRSSPATQINQVAASKSNLDSQSTLSSDVVLPRSVNQAFYTLEFDGVSTGRPPRAGAGALLRHPEGALVFELAESLGQATSNVAEYRALILGLQEAERRSILHLQAKGGSSLVCEQLLGKRTVTYHHVKLYNEAKALIEKFSDFSIKQIDSSLNEDAHALAKRATALPGKVQGSKAQRKVILVHGEEIPSTLSDAASTGSYGYANANNQWKRIPAFSTAQLQAACTSCRRSMSSHRATQVLHGQTNAVCGGKAAIWLTKLGRPDRPWAAAAKCLTQFAIVALAT